MKKPICTDDDLALFRDAVADTRPLAQDTIGHQPRRRPASDNKRVMASKALPDPHSLFYFSDHYQPHFGESWPNFVRDDISGGELKKLRRGDYAPQVTLDLHGLNREQAKLELAALLAHAERQQLSCVCVVHGIGGGTLKRQLPCWLAQHPRVLAVHSAPREYGGQGALLVLLEQELAFG